jgi:hypothetical protein
MTHRKGRTVLAVPIRRDLHRLLLIAHKVLRRDTIDCTAQPSLEGAEGHILLLHSGFSGVRPGLDCDADISGVGREVTVAYVVVALRENRADLVPDLE